VPTLASSEVVKCGSLAEQIKYHREWICSLLGEDYMNNTEFPVPEDAKHEAKLHPGGYVYRIDGQFGPDERVPAEAIIGAWKVDEDGNIIEPFVQNPNYKPRT
jgi:hypothetical protein